MSRFPELVAALGLLVSLPALADGNPEKGEKIFKKCKACHQVGISAKHRTGPHLNALVGRVAGELEDFKYSTAMSGSGVIWDEETLSAFLADPKTLIPGTRMTFAGLRSADDIGDVIAYLATFAGPSTEAIGEEKIAMESNASPVRDDGVYGLGRLASEAEIAAWDIDVRPDGAGLPPGRGDVLTGEEVFAEACAVCHGDFGEGVDRWPVLAGGHDTLTEDRPEKTIGSYWPYLSTVWDYIRRAMPFGNAQTLSDDDVYAITAYLLYMNDLVEEEFELSHENFAEVRLPNEGNFYMDDRLEQEFPERQEEVCMEGCKDDVEIIMRAAILDVTPETDDP